MFCFTPLVKNGSRYLKRVGARSETFEKIQRFKCKLCKKTYIFRKDKTGEVRRKFTDSFITESVCDFIQGRSSYAVIKERKNVSIGTLSKWVNAFGNSCLSPIEISEKLKLNEASKWSGTLLLDGKYLNKNSCLLLAVDYLTLDIVAHLVVDKESGKNYTKLINLVLSCGYNIKALVSDGHPSIRALTQTKKLKPLKRTRNYPRPGIPPVTRRRSKLEGVPHAWCVVHAQRELFTNLTKLKLSKEFNLKLRKQINSILFANTLSKAKKNAKKLAYDTRSRPKVFSTTALWILERLEYLTLHFNLRVNKRKIPRSTNLIENVISYVNTRLKTMRRIRNRASAVAITNLIVLNYRTKPLINTKNKLKRGKSPLSLALGKKLNLKWTTFIKKSTA